MDNLRDKLKSFTEQDYADKKVDLHIHTICSDGGGKYEQIVASAKDKNYKLIAITDHNSVEVHKQIQDDILLTGAEFDCWFGYVFIHLLAYGIDINNPNITPFLAKDKKGTESAVLRLFSTRNVPKLIEAIHSAGGIAVLAHPACYWAINLETLVTNLMEIGLDGIEVFYPYPRFRSVVKFHSAKTVKKIADKHPDLIQTGGTDFHGENF